MSLVWERALGREETASFRVEIDTTQSKTENPYSILMDCHSPLLASGLKFRQSFGLSAQFSSRTIGSFLVQPWTWFTGQCAGQRRLPHDEELGRLTDNPRITVWKGFTEVCHLFLLRKGHSFAFSKESHIIRSTAGFLLLGEQDLGVNLISLTDCSLCLVYRHAAGENLKTK